MSDFKVLSDIEHIRLRSGMYIGSSTVEEHTGYVMGEWKTLKVVPGLIKIINEIIDNAIDEFIRTHGEHSNKIDIKIQKDTEWFVSVSDNGRGIPTDKIDGVYRAVLAWTKARAGSNFDDTNRVTTGMNGIGSFATNVFSTDFVGITTHNGTKLTVKCKQGELVSVKESVGTTAGTTVKFYPELSFFNVNEIDEDHITYIKDRLNNLSVSYPKIKFSINGEKIFFRNAKTLAKTFSDDTVIIEQDNSLMILGSTGAVQEYRHLSYVNGLHLKSGGTHIDFFLSQLIEEMRPAIKRKWKIEVLPNHIKQNLFLVSYFTNFKNCKFDSQTKERITNTQAEISHLFQTVNFAKIAKQIIGNENIINPIIQSILAKKALAEQLALARAQKKKKVKIANHIQANDTDPEKRTLYITEGLSAIGPLISVRDGQLHGGYPLKGKVMNVHGMKPIDIIKNKELSELMQIIGLEFGKPATNLEYGKIAVLTDADVDGQAILCLLVNFFRLWPELFEQGRICTVQTPRYIVREKKKTSWYYTDAEFAAVKHNGTVDYIKGLGTLEKEDYKEIINNPRLIKITLDDKEDIGYIDMAFNDDADSRKEWMLNGSK